MLIYLGIGAALILFLVWRSPVWFVYLLRLVWLPFQAVLWLLYLVARIHGSIFGWVIFLLVAFVALVNMMTPSPNDSSSWGWFIAFFLTYRSMEFCRLYAGNIRNLAAWTPRTRTTNKPKAEKIPVVNDVTGSAGSSKNEDAMISGLAPHLQDLIRGAEKQRASGGDILDEMIGGDGD